jgi:hypothetical protein
MRLDDLLDIVDHSSPDDWQRQRAPTFYRWRCAGEETSARPVPARDGHLTVSISFKKKLTAASRAVGHKGAEYQTRTKRAARRIELFAWS